MSLATAGLTAFAIKVYDATRAIPSGETRSYGELASTLGAPKASRAVGTALGKNPFPILVPCHRVLGQNKRIGGFSAPGGVEAKRAMLVAEGADLTPKRRIVLANARTLEAAVGHLASSSRAMASWVAHVGPPALSFMKPVETFAALTRSIVFQQLNGKAAATIHGRVVALFPDESVHAAAMDHITDDGLRGAGLSANKLRALRDLARRSLDGTVPPLALLRRMTDDAIVERLVTVRGIGRWTVEMLLLFRLRRLDVWPTDDFGVQTGYARVFGVNKPSAKALMALGDAFRPYRSVASWYLWRAADEAKTLKR